MGPSAASTSLIPAAQAASTADVPFEDGDACLGLELLRGFVVAAIIRGHLVAGPFQLNRDGGADTARTARDQCNPSHVQLPVKTQDFLLFSTHSPAS